MAEDELLEVNLHEVANALRTRSTAWGNAKYEYDQVKEVSYSQLTKSRTDTATLESVLVHTYDYLHKRLGSGMSAVCSNSFLVDYLVRGNMDRPARFGPECLGLSFRVDWKTEDVMAELYDGEALKIALSPDLNAILIDGRVRNLTKFAEVTGLKVSDVRDARADEASQLLNVIRHSAAGQNKLTRLVKGCLMYLDHLEKGAQEYKMPTLSTITYNVDGLVSTLPHGNRAYVFSDQPAQHVSNWILYAMCEEYPHATIGGCEHVTIPADAEKVFLVANKPLCSPENVCITPELVWGTLIHYTNNFRLGRDLEKALAIACSLRQNRYLKVVGLPRVLSNVDLIYPMLSSMSCGITDKTFMDFDASIVLGRVHQMLMMLLVKDVDTSARCSSSMKGMVDRNVMSLLSRDRRVFQEYIEDKSVVDVLKISAPMLWLNYLNPDSLKHIRGISVFEGFWLLKYPKEVFKAGVISNLKRGMKDPIGVMDVGVNIDSFSILLSEVRLGGGCVDLGLPDGAFNVSFSVMRGPRQEVSPITFEFEADVAKVEYRDMDKTVVSERGGTLPCDFESNFVREGSSWGWDVSSNFDEDDERDEEFDGNGDEDEGGDDTDDEDDEDEWHSYEVGSVSQVKGAAGPGIVYNKDETPVGYTGASGDRPRTPVTPVETVKRIRIAERPLSLEELADEEKYLAGMGLDELVAYLGSLVAVENKKRARISNSESKHPRTREDEEDLEDMRVGLANVRGKIERAHAWKAVLMARIEADAAIKENFAAARRKAESEAAGMAAKLAAEAAASAEAARMESDKAAREREFSLKSQSDSVNKLRYGVKGLTAEKLILDSGVLADTGFPIGSKEDEEIRFSLPPLKTPIEKGQKKLGSAMKSSSTERSPGLNVWDEFDGEGVTVPEGEMVSFEKNELTQFYSWTVAELMNPKLRMSKHVENFRGYLGTLAFGSIRNGKVEDFFHSVSWKSKFISEVSQFDDHGKVDVQDYPADCREVIIDLRRRLSDEWLAEEKRIELYKAPSGVLDPLHLSVFKHRSNWAPEVGVNVELGDLRGVSHLLVLSDWWRSKVRRMFSTYKGIRQPTLAELQWLAKYIDSGGDLDHWPLLWKMCNNDVVLRTRCDWARVSGRLKEISRESKEIQKTVLPKWPSGNLTLNEISLFGTVAASPDIMYTAEEANELFEEIAYMGIGKRQKLLAQYYATRVAICHPMVYVGLCECMHLIPAYDALFKADFKKWFEWYRN